LAAFVGIGQILTGNDRDFKVLGTAVTIALASVCGLGCGAALESKRARVMPILGLILTAIGTVQILFIIWSEPFGNTELWWKSTLIVSIFAVACSHVSLLSIARLAPQFDWAMLISFLAIFSVAALITIPIVVERLWREEWWVRGIAVTAIIDAAMSLLIPIFHVMSRPMIAEIHARARSSSAAIDNEIAQLESRLAELRKLRDSGSDTPA
jgi:hypothetical protein